MVYIFRYYQTLRMDLIKLNYISLWISGISNADG